MFRGELEVARLIAEHVHTCHETPASTTGGRVAEGPRPERGPSATRERRSSHQRPQPAEGPGERRRIPVLARPPEELDDVLVSRI